MNDLYEGWAIVELMGHRHKAALAAIMDVPANATVLNVQFIAKAALGGVAA